MSREPSGVGAHGHGEVGHLERNPAPEPRKLRSEPSSRRDRVRLEATVRGRVQGVGFRHFAARHALALGLHGWVRNAPDGTVRVAAEGPEAGVERFLRLLRQGPSWAHVDQVEAFWGPPSGQEAGFRIR